MVFWDEHGYRKLSSLPQGAAVYRDYLFPNRSGSSSTLRTRQFKEERMQRQPTI